MYQRLNIFSILSLFAILITVAVASFGLFDHGPGAIYQMTNQYADVVKLYGRGLYKDDSFFRVPIFRGTDATMLILVCPLAIYAWIKNRKMNVLKTQIPLLSLVGVILYYASSIGLGVKYNYLHLAYTALFGCSVYAFISGMATVDTGKFKDEHLPLPFRGIYIFLTLTGTALVIAWLPDIVTSLIRGRSLLMIEHYTTEITYVLDMGLIAPACFACIYLLKKRAAAGYILLDVLLTLCMVMGIMLPVQTLFQEAAGISLPLPVIITKVASFTILAAFAVFFKFRLSKVFKDGLPKR